MAEEEEETNKIKEMGSFFEEKEKGNSGDASAESTPAVSPVSFASSAEPFVPVDSSSINPEKARRTMASIRNPGQNRPGSNYESTSGGMSPKTTQQLKHIQPGSHPWINMGNPGGAQVPSGRKKIVIPPPGAWGDSHPSASRK